MIIGITLAHHSELDSNTKYSFMFFPLAIHSLDMIASTIGTFFVKTKSGLP